MRKKVNKSHIKSFLFFILLITSLNGLATRRYVKVTGTGSGTSWATASKDLQLMINNSLAGDEIWIAEGTYKPVRRADAVSVITSNDRNNAFVLKSGVIIYGGFTGNELFSANRNFINHKVILSGNIGTSAVTDNCYHVVISAGNNNATLLDGVWVVDGNSAGTNLKGSLTVNGYSIAFSSGAGCYLRTSSVVIKNCTIQNNTAAYNGGGIYDSLSPSPSILNCTISGNYAYNHGGGAGNISSIAVITGSTFSHNIALKKGGAVYSAGLAGTFTNNTFSNNSADAGGAMYNDAVSPYVKSCVFTADSSYHEGGAACNISSNAVFDSCNFKLNYAGSSGGALYFVMASQPVVKNCIIAGNFASVRGGGIRLEWSTDLTLINSVIRGNSGSLGGGLDFSTANYLIINSTIAANLARQSYGGGLYAPGCTHREIKNSIFQGNTSGSQPSDVNTITAADDPIVSYTIFPFLFAGTGNIAADPLFISPVSSSLAPTIAGNYRLQNLSPAINTGSNALIPAGITTDIDGNNRILQGTVDMGPYEMNYQLRIAAGSGCPGYSSATAITNPLKN